MVSKETQEVVVLAGAATFKTTQGFVMVEADARANTIIEIVPHPHRPGWWIHRTGIYLLTLALLLGSSVRAQVVSVEEPPESKPSAAIDIRTGSVTEILSAERITASTDPDGVLIVDPAPVGLPDPEPILVAGMFQGWREKGCCPRLEILGRPSNASRDLPIVIGNGEPGRSVTISAATDNVTFSGRDLPNFPSATFDAEGKISFKIAVSGAGRWIVHVAYRGQLVELRDQWSQVADF